MLSDIAALWLAAIFLIASLAVIVWWVAHIRKQKTMQGAGTQPGMLLGFLILAAFAMGIFLTYALLGLR